MIIEVGIDDEEPRRYQVRRDGEKIVVHKLDGADPSNPGSAATGGRGGEGNGGDGGDGGTVVDWCRPQAGIYSLLVDGASYEVFIEEEQDHLAVHLVERTFRIHAADVRRHRASTGATKAADGLVRITAPIPGRVSRILVETGQAVQSGDGVVVLEAMKMENELRAPRDGVVTGIDVEEGQGVEGGALLASIE